MVRCSHCNRVLKPSDELCPSCACPRKTKAHGAESRKARELLESAPFPDDDQTLDAMSPVARFTNAAEAGYFAHELQHSAELPVCLSAEEHFDAVSGHWTTRFVLLSPDEWTDRVAGALAAMLDESDSEYTDVGALPVSTARRCRGVEDELETGTVNWVPIVLTLAAGSVAFWGLRQANDVPKQPAGRPAVGGQRDELWDQLGNSAAPWTQTLEDGRGRRELRIDRRRDVVLLREDADGDGFFEREVPLNRRQIGQ